ncbi:RES family NAD+ phosphorylase [Massilia sp. TS11]|uniref:RES family NAD+ phosphorylase n=1 Tax=Massilia sp. TS11 TaxID=2908003 RepID=UPI001EDB3F4D|nr:RES family NAD+ phosphorylase [Massilia sp. TS11]MCG2582813.1 RES family NAD+ phosphorylase [Massilia sp. TS11]
MSSIFSGLALVEVDARLLRNIVSLRVSEDLFDDLSPAAADWALAQQVEDASKPPVYRSPQPVIDRPFEDAAWFNAIQWPFAHWQQSRFSDGRYGVWYGSDSVETTAWETAWHWYHGLIRDAGFEHEAVTAERRIYTVHCRAALLDLRPKAADFPDLLHKSDYSFAQSVGARIRHEGHPGLVTLSARRSGGENTVIFNPAVLSQPRHHAYLSYKLQGGQIRVERTPGRRWFDIPIT